MADWTRTTLVMSPELKNRVERAAKLHGASVSAIVRKMIERGLPVWEGFDDEQQGAATRKAA